MKLMRKGEFAPFFWTQFLGAFNDNIFKNSLILLIAFSTASETRAGFQVNVASALFMAPFIFLSPLAGQLAVRYNKAFLCQQIKKWEIPLMILAAFGFLNGGRVGFLIFVLFLSGCRSAIFGPVKYGIVRDALPAADVVSATALIEMGTFMAILLGTLAGGILVETGYKFVAAAIVTCAVLGYIASRNIPALPATSPTHNVKANPFVEVHYVWLYAKKRPWIIVSILAISWFWFLGAIVLSQVPTYVSHTLHGHSLVVTLFLSTFTLSVGAGSMLAARFSKGRLEVGLIPIGTVGLVICLADLGTLDYSPFAARAMGSLTLMDFIWHNLTWTNVRILFDLAGIGASGSFFIVPLNAILQQRSSAQETARIIGGSNFVNGIFLVASALVAMLFYHLGFETVELFTAMAIATVVYFAFIAYLSPEFHARLFVILLGLTQYRWRLIGRGLCPQNGAGIVVITEFTAREANSWQRLLAIAASWTILGRPIQFIGIQDGVLQPIQVPRWWRPFLGKKTWNRLSPAPQGPWHQSLADFANYNDSLIGLLVPRHAAQSTLATLKQSLNPDTVNLFELKRSWNKRITRRPTLELELIKSVPSEKVS